MNQRTCADCSADISDRPKFAYLCRACAKARQVAHRRAYYAAHPKGGARYTGMVGTEIGCSGTGCKNRFVKRGGNHIFCDDCRLANESYHDSVWNSKHPERAHGPALNGRWGAVSAAA